MFDNHVPKRVNTFGGLYGRDEYEDSCPADHFPDSLNTINKGSQLGTREGFSSFVTLSNIRRVRVYKREGEAARLLILNSSGEIYDATASLVTPILTIVGMTDFATYYQYNRCYITPHNGVKGLSGEYVYVYQGSGTARKAAGLAPVAGFNCAVSGTAGNIEEGTHLFAWCFETNTGYITQPSEAEVLTFDGTKAADFTNIPTGPSGTSARRLIASRAIQDYNGDPEAYEMFFVSEGRVTDNSTTSLSAVNFFDAELQISADYTYDQLEEIPAGCAFVKYENKMCVVGTNENPSLCYVSKDGEPESFNSLAGFLVCDPTETEGLKGGIEFRNNLYLFKGSPGHTYVTQNNGYEASTWNCPRISSSIGCNINGIAQFMEQPGADASNFLVADVNGLYNFNGTYADLPLSWKIENWWRRINKAYFHLVQVIIDPTKELIYVLVPLDSATNPTHIFVGSYEQGLNYESIIWHKWTIGSITNLASIDIDIDYTTKLSKLILAAWSGNVYRQVADQYNDASNAYESYVKFAYLYHTAGWVHHFVGTRWRILGNSGTLTITAYPLDSTTTHTLPTLTLAATPGREYHLPMNVNNEKCAVKFSLNTVDCYWKLREFTLFCQPVWQTRPY